MSNVRLTIAQIRPKKADYAENLRRIGSVFAQVATLEEPPQLVVFPETVTSGYFLEGGVRDAAVTAGTLLEDLSLQHERAGAPPIDVVVGFYEEFRNHYYNSGLYATLGPDAKLRHVHRKVFLPTYGLFDEERFVERGHSVQAFDTSWGRAAMLICEDAWHSITAMLAALDGAQLLIIPSASPARGALPDVVVTDDTVARPASVRRWEALVSNIASEHGVFVTLAQLVGFEGGKGFQGSSTVVSPSGEVLVRGPVFEEALVAADLHLDVITRVRAAQPLLADLKSELLNLLRRPDDAASVPEYDPADGKSAASAPGERAAPSAFPVVVAEETWTFPELNCKLATDWLVRFLQDEVVHRRNFTKGIVGLSGGVDSSLTAALAARALGPDNVIGVRMPYRTSNPESLAHAELIATQLGIRLETVDISAAVDGYINAADGEASPERRGNVMARLRMVTLFDLSAKYRALPLGTGNKTERLLGYFTWHADDSPPVNPLGDLFKTQVWQLARYLGVPDEIVSKPATADLIQGQTDEGDLGVSYETADRILYSLLRGLKRDRIVALGFTNEEIELVSRRLHGTHWKRRLATVALMSNTAIGESYLRPVDF